jgi:type IV pilus assembly protein PilE
MIQPHSFRSSGFTLIELMVTIVILAIIVGIAYPSYRNYTVQTRRSDAQSALTQTANRQEKFFSSCSRYTTTLVGGSMSDCTAGGLGFANSDSPDGHYQVTIAGTTIAGTGTIATAFTATATPKAGGLQVGNGALRIDSTGVKQWDKNNDNSFSAKWTDK